MVVNASSPHAFTPQQRLHKRKQFLSAYDEGSRSSGRLMTVFVSPNNLPLARLGVSATRRFGAAVARNTAKRRLREAFRCHIAPQVTGVDIVVIPKHELLAAEFTAVVGELRHHLRRPQRRRESPGRARP